MRSIAEPEQVGLSAAGDCMVASQGSKCGLQRSGLEDLAGRRLVPGPVTAKSSERTLDRFTHGVLRSAAGRLSNITDELPGQADAVASASCCPATRFGVQIGALRFAVLLPNLCGFYLPFSSGDDRL